MLDSSQKLVLGGMVGCMRTTPRAACEVLLKIPPLDLWIRGVVFKTLSRIKENCSISNFFDWEFAGELGLESPIAMDGCIKKLSFLSKR